MRVLENAVRTCSPAGFARLLFLCLFLSGGLVSTAQANCADIRPTKPGEIYFMRGLANIFSLGLDAFAKEISDLGIENCVFNHTHWQAVVNDVVERGYKNEVSEPVIIVGHSLGANIAPLMASRIGSHGIKVYYVAMMDPVEPTRVGKNVREIENFYLPKNKDTLLRPTRDFDGDLKNTNLKQWRQGFDHFNIDEKRSLRSIIKKRILELVESTMQENDAQPQD